MIRLTVRTKSEDGTEQTHHSGERDGELFDVSWVVRVFMRNRRLTEMTFILKDE